MDEPDLILASSSPRRSELLQQLGVSFSVNSVDIDERPDEFESPEQFVTRMAAEKSRAGIEQVGGHGLILAADTIVVLEGKIFGKPHSRDHAFEMLSLLSGRTHEVMSAVSLRGEKQWQALSTSRVTFRKISDAEKRNYWLSGEPHDKAGGYAIQGVGAIFVEWLEGSYSGVMGLPIFETAQLLNEAGIGFYE